MITKKRFFSGWVAGIAVGIASVTFAGSTNFPFGNGDTLTSAQMQAVQGAVNDNNGRITALETGAPPCPANMTRVGATCVDNTRSANGLVSWVGAVNACRAAGKRLPTPGEYMAAHGSGLFADMVATDPNQYEWVDAVSSEDVSAFAGSSRGRLTAGYMGPDNGNTAGINAPGEIFFATNAEYDNATLSFIGYRCAR